MGWFFLLYEWLGNNMFCNFVNFFDFYKFNKFYFKDWLRNLWGSNFDEWEYVLGLEIIFYIYVMFIFFLLLFLMIGK